MGENTKLLKEGTNFNGERKENCETGAAGGEKETKVYSKKRATRSTLT